ncbi:hypothetical protein FIBSPDRAFT_938220 [Athelia psychrophila]|uniref:Uncharacterized protein n=1 Tax=Athelia psychrophila TaxID=1759441 RepID=A0A165YYU4_9AGAM|nr:hypothetical protein FIBSPDRAFT_938220 [Fibularhizoctonia sp. CBS 109695]
MPFREILRGPKRVYGDFREFLAMTDVPVARVRTPPFVAVRPRHASEVSLESLRTRFAFSPPAPSKNANIFIDDEAFLVSQDRSSQGTGHAGVQLIQHEFSLPHNEARNLGDATTIKICEVYGFNGNRDMNSSDTLFRDGYGAEVDYAGYNGEGVEENAKLA